MSFSTAAGTMISIGPRLTTDLPKVRATAITQLSAITYVDIGEVESIGDYGDSVGDVTFSSLGDARTRHAKGLADAGTIEIVMALTPGEAGQLALAAAGLDRSRYDYPIKVEYVDGSIDYFAGKVMGSKKSVGSAENVIKRTVTVGINSEIYEIDAP